MDGQDCESGKRKLIKAVKARAYSKLRLSKSCKLRLLNRFQKVPEQ